MNIQSTPRPGRALRLLDLALRGLRVLLIIVTVTAVPLLLLVVSGRGSIEVNGLLDAPFTVELDEGRRIGVSGNTRTFENFDIGRERVIVGTPTVEATVPVEREDLDTRITVVAVASLWLGAAWLGLRSFRAITASARRGEWLPAENPRRLRLLGGAILAYAATGLIGQALLRMTLDTTLPFQPSLDLSTWLISGLVGVAVLALAEPFAEAARLREFDESAI